MVNIGYVQDDRTHALDLSIFTESERAEISEIFKQKDREYRERSESMTMEEQIEAAEELDNELGKIFEQFKAKALKRQQNIATA